MMSTVLPSDSLLSLPNNNPFNGGFTPWENLESFFTSTDHKPNTSLENKHDYQTKPQAKPKLRRYHARMNVGSACPNKQSHCLDVPNISSYDAGSNLGLKDIDKKLPCLDKSNLGCYHAGLDLGSECPTLDCHHVGSNLGFDSSFDKTTLTNDQPSSNPVLPISCANDQLSPNSVLSNSTFGLDDPNQNPKGSNLNSYADEPDQAVNIMDERKRKRMISNRDSARRSRMRKQRHVENLRNDVNQLKIQTRERSNQLRLMTHHIQLIKRENDRLKAESIILQSKLNQLAQIWQLQQLQRQCSSYHHHPTPPPTSSCTAVQRIN